MQSITSLPCPSCAMPINLSSVNWCQCVSKALSAICPSCKACFCKISLFSMRAEWTEALKDLREHQTMEKFRRAVVSSANAPKGSTVLIVDDDEEIRLIAEYSIQQMGYRTLSAANAADALEIVRRSRPGIVLTDALMPMIDGRQLCRLIKAVDASTKVIVMSALYTSSRYRVEALSVFGADEYLTKPIDFGILRQVLGNLAWRAA